MTEFESVMRRHAEKYGKMQPTDAVKLAFQNEFGCGHMIPSPEKSLAFLKAELETCDGCPDELYESIGNGWVRVNLSCWSGTPEQLNRLFVKSANGYTGCAESFEEKLKIVENLARDGIFGFTESDYSSYIDEYRKAGYPPVSHSREYRDEYRPAYRVIRLELLEAEI